jgi:CDGSH-type Zn-finger protein
MLLGTHRRGRPISREVTIVPDERPSVKNEKQYEALKDEGMSKERAARIANSPGASSRGGKKSGSGSRRRTTSQGGTAAQKKAAGAKGGRVAARKPIVNRRDEVTIVRVTEDGPLLVRGSIRLVDERGDAVPTRRRVNALCRCGRSASQPFCDGTHKIVPFSPRAVRGAGGPGPGTGSPIAG